MNTKRPEVFLANFLTLGLLFGLGCRAADVPEPPQRRGPADSGTVTPPSQPEPTATAHSEPLQVPEYLAPMHDLLELGRVGLALDLADALLEAHPDDAWVVADVGFAKAAFPRSGGDPDGELLQRALELAKEPSLRALILLYQARIQQQRDGLAAGRPLVVAALAEYPLGPAQRNLELIDAGLGQLHNSTSPLIQPACQQQWLPKTTSKQEYVTCVGVDVGETQWIRVTQVFDDKLPTLRVFHYWRLVSPASANPKGLRENGGDDRFAPCWSNELVTLAGSYGGEGAVLEVEQVTHDSKEYVVVHCQQDQISSDDDGRPGSLAASLYLHVCSLDSGWCTRELYTRQALHDGSTLEAKIEVRDGRIVTTRPGEGPQLGVFP